MKPEIEDGHYIVQNKTSHGAHKIHLTAELKLLKQRVDEDEHTTIFANTDLKTVDYDNLFEDKFFAMTQQKTCDLSKRSVNCFSLNGNG